VPHRLLAEKQTRRALVRFTLPFYSGSLGTAKDRYGEQAALRSENNQLGPKETTIVGEETKRHRKGAWDEGKNVNKGGKSESNESGCGAS
jgi:hypothetical protein